MVSCRQFMPVCAYCHLLVWDVQRKSEPRRAIIAASDSTAGLSFSGVTQHLNQGVEAGFSSNIPSFCWNVRTAPMLLFYVLCFS